MTKPTITIACICHNGAIGENNNLIFRNKTDMKFFRETTISAPEGKRNAVIMGRKTFESFPGILIGRLNCIISNTLSECMGEDLIISKNIKKIHDELLLNDSIHKIYIIGGNSIYKYFMDHTLTTHLILTEINNPEDTYGDTFFPEVNFKNYTLIDTVSLLDVPVKNNVTKKKEIIDYEIKYYENIITNMDHQEYEYLNVLQKVLDEGTLRQTRNALTKSLFGVKMCFDASESFPLLTTKRMFWRGILGELLWFLKGSTDSKVLEEDKINIWKGNSTREFLDDIGLNQRREGDCGPIYGFQWRHFNAKYEDCDTDYTGEGIDQLQNIINLINENPTSRRMYMTAWNPCQLDEMALPPCHISYQFYVRDKDGQRYLDCMMYQRSGDLFLGVPFNIASTSTLTCIIANICNIRPGKIHLVIGDAHIYNSHIDAVKEQLKRKPHPLPTLKINRKLTSLDDLVKEDFEIENYKYHKSIKAEMIA